ncbi:MULTISPECIES: hypothetical protein [Cyanophyceae]|uniref:arginine synthesis PII-interacting regulator PirA n=1 Tax=Cyanophyceae TaxID=3028117 RepID=UPI00016DC46D|nr:MULTISPECIES: hypothetical protein [Cyanophyceae]ACA98275.1 conserved hypothetical protein [Picosynechococcus sp. PCC 7002]SMH45273.1 hypothetical protein SAMN06272755_1549 [Picosynechococcus sp. OG1]SMQ80162.1 hypothetical protein SAMN06272774_0829 [Synechococcus sp. 7002]
MFRNVQQQIVKQIKRTHRENLKKNLQHRLEAARNSGNDHLVQQLEAEAQYLGIG